MTFVSGSPGCTSRGMTLVQVEDQRDNVLPIRLMDLAQTRGWITEYQQRGKEQLRHSNDDLFGIENSFKALKGQHGSLANASFIAQLHKDEADFRRKSCQQSEADGGRW